MSEIVKDRFDGARVFWGICLIAFGVIALLDRLHVGDFDLLVRRYWPMVFVVVGLSKLLNRNVWGAFWFIAAGAWIEIVHLRLWGVTFESSWPLALVAAGVAIVLRAILDTRRREIGPPEQRHG